MKHFEHRWFRIPENLCNSQKDQNHVSHNSPQELPL